MLVIEAAGSLVDAPGTNERVFGEVQSVAAHALKSTMRSIADVIAVGRSLCEATQRLLDMSVAANSARLIETIAWVATVASGFGATEDMLLELRLYKARACALHAKDFKQARKEFMDVAKKLPDVHSFTAFACLLQGCGDIVGARAVLKRAAVQTDAAAANAQLLQLESLNGPLEFFIDARKRAAAVASASANVTPAASAKAGPAAAGKGAKKVEDDTGAPLAKRPRPSSDAPQPAPASSAVRKESQPRPSPAAAVAGDISGGEELTLHVRHAFEIRELSLRKLYLPPRKLKKNQAVLMLTAFAQV
jgi:hypothetical protein